MTTAIGVTSGGRSRAPRPRAGVLAALLFTIGINQACAEGAAVVLCRADQVPGAEHTVLIARHGGDLALAFVRNRDQVPGRACFVHPVDPSPNRVLWLGATSSAQWAPDRGLTLVWQPGNDRLGTIEFPSPAGGPAGRVLGPGAEVLPARMTRPFGAAKRVGIVTEGSSVTLSCADGDEPAGVVLELNGVPAAEARLGVEIAAGGDAGFSAHVSIGETGQPANSAPLLPSNNRLVARLAIPRADELAIAISCPVGPGHLQILRGTIVSAGEALPQRAAAWVWEQDLWRHEPDRLLGWARRWSVATLFVSVGVEAGKVRDAASLAGFIQRARIQDVAVVAVEGDPGMIDGEGRELALARARALADYQAAHPAARLSGLQYDIEPYIAAGFATDSTTAWRRWGETLRLLSAAYGEKVDVVVPFWLLGSAGGAEALAAVAPALEQLTIMAYRTDTAAVISAAAPLLAWASVREISATVALESGPLLPELREHFEPADAGELHAYAIGDFVAFVLLDGPRTANGAGAYRRRHIAQSKPARLTFAGQPARLAGAIHTLTAGLSAWPAARRIAIHGLAESELATPPDQTTKETRK